MIHFNKGIIFSPNLLHQVCWPIWVLLDACYDIFFWVKQEVSICARFVLKLRPLLFNLTTKTLVRQVLRIELFHHCVIEF